MRLPRFAVFIFIALLFAPRPAYAIKRLKKTLERYNNENYRSALSKTEDYLLDYPKDNLALDMKDMILTKQAVVSLKKAYTLKSEGDDNEPVKNFQKANELDSQYATRIEDRYEVMLKTMSPQAAADNIILYMLRSPVPTESVEYSIERRVRDRYATVLSETERITLEELKKEVNKLAEDEKFDEAVEMIMGFMNNNPGSSDAKVLLSKINRKAAQYFYRQAEDLIKDDEIEKGRKEALVSKRYDHKWYQQKIAQKMEEAKTSIAIGDDAGARTKLQMLSHLNPKERGPSLYLSLFEEDRTGFIQRSIEIYKNREYEEAMVRFDFLRLKQPENEDAQLYYHLAAARQSIRRQDLNKVREHLISALKISPDEKKALAIYDRLQDVLEIMGKG